MSFVPPASLLRGLPLGAASCMGMPHWQARYASDDARSNRLLEGAVCAACGAPASNCHHEPPLGMGGANRGWALRAPMGSFVLKPALIALCGSGTEGCHGMRHAGLVSVRWEWDSDGAAEAWWSGELLAHGTAPHSPSLYRLGRWVVEGPMGRSVLRGDARCGETR